MTASVIASYSTLLSVPVRCLGCCRVLSPMWRWLEWLMYIMTVMPSSVYTEGVGVWDRYRGLLTNGTGGYTPYRCLDLFTGQFNISRVMGLVFVIPRTLYIGICEIFRKLDRILAATQVGLRPLPKYVQHALLRTPHPHRVRFQGGSRSRPMQRL